MANKEKANNKKIKWIYQGYQKVRDAKWFVILWYICLIIPIVLDLVPFQYWSKELEMFFMISCAERSHISTILIGVWAFIGALLIFWLGLFKEKHYGIPNVDIIFTNISVLNRVMFIGIYILELVELEVVN